MGQRHYRQGVVNALKKVNAEAQNKSSRHNLSETDLFNQLFSANPAQPGEPRLRLSDDDGSDTFKKGTAAPGYLPRAYSQAFATSSRTRSSKRRSTSRSRSSSSRRSAC